MDEKNIVANTDEKNLAVKNEEPEVEAHILLGAQDVVTDIATGAERSDGTADLALDPKGHIS